MCPIRIVLFAVLLCLSPVALAQYISVDDTYTPQQLVENVLVNTPCADVSNVTASGWQAFMSYGYFDQNNSSFPFQEGVVLTTGRAVSAEGPNTTLLSKGDSNWLGDSDLEQAINEFNTVNATVLAFDFLPYGNRISFDYIFSSEQYYAYSNPNQCQFSDGFAFLLKEAGSSAPYQNLALLPQTNIPVKVTTVRGEGTICPAANPQYFDAFNGTQHPTNYNGQTAVLTATANVAPGTLYHIKLVIADQGNELYDSAIFIQGGSFSVETDLGEDRLVATGNPLCNGQLLDLDATHPGNNSYQWFHNNTLLPAATNSVYTVSQPGLYRVEIVFGNGGCTTSSEIEIEYTTPTPGNNAVLIACAEDASGGALFNLTAAVSQITQGNTNLQVQGFYPTVQDAENGTNPVSSSTAYATDIPVVSVYARVVDVFGCVSVSEVELQATAVFYDTIELAACSLSNQPQYAVFNLNQAATEIYVLYGQNLQLSFHETLSQALDPNAVSNSLPVQYMNTLPTSQTVYARLEDQSGCAGIVPIVLYVIAVPQLGDDTEEVLCRNNGDEYLILSSGVGGVGTYQFLWSTGQDTPTIQVSQAGTYSVTVWQTTIHNGQAYVCESTRQLTVRISEVAQATYTGSQNHGTQTVTVSVDGVGDYEYSLNNPEGPFQESPVFHDVPPGHHHIYVRDRNGCGMVVLEVYILGFPNFFTPNNDGHNDYWQIALWDFGDVQLADVHIYDRYGKVVHRLDRNTPGWDGTYKGRPLPSDDYWFKAVFSDGTSHRGHFSMKR